MGGDKNRHLGRERDFFRLRFFLQDRHSGFEVGRLDVGNESPFEAITQTLLQSADLVRELVGSKDDLLMGVVERIKSMEKFLLRALAAGQKLHIVEDENVGLAELIFEVVHPVAAQVSDQLV